MIPVTREVDFYEKYGEEFIGTIDVSEIPLKKLRKIVLPKMDDDLLYDLYLLSKEQLDEINKLIKIPIKYSLDKHEYFLGCTAVEGYYEKHKIRGGRKGGYPPPG
jgi:hypothetical protein